VIEDVRRLLGADSRIAYAMLFGSTARQTRHAHSDLDIAIGTADPIDTRVFGELTARLEQASGCPVHLVSLNDAPPGLAYRVFRDGSPLVIRDDAAFRARLARAILEYLDFKPIEDLFTHGVLRARHG
jgi:predicted nucleotidyltransferase